MPAYGWLILTLDFLYCTNCQNSRHKFFIVLYYFAIYSNDSGIITALMIDWKNKWVYFALEALNSFACSYFFNFLFFFLRDNYHFGNRENLAVTAFHGLIYTIASWQGGKFIEKNGQVRSLKIGIIGMILFLICGIQFSRPLPAVLLILLGWTISMCLIWPAIESLVSLNEPSKELPRMVGIYNAVWAGSSAVAYFIGGALYEHLGWKSLFWLPPIIHIIQLILLKKFSNEKHQLVNKSNNNEPEQCETNSNIPDKSTAEKFLKMAWIANPFAYVAMNTFLAVIPEIAKNQNLNPTQAGLFCSIWFFVRLGAFILLWKWDGWHYRFFWLFKAFIFLIAGFLILLISNNLLVLVFAQVIFGWAVGLIYYSSLYYAMHVGEAGASHGGLHEAAIGAGIFLGPAIGSSTLYLLPQYPNVAIYAIATLLLVALFVMILLNYKKQK